MRLLVIQGVPTARRIHPSYMFSPSIFWDVTFLALSDGYGDVEDAGLKP